VHCYRIVGSVQDAKDLLRSTLLAAWRGIGGPRGTRVDADVAAPDRYPPLSQCIAGSARRHHEYVA
jgi:hypothetical protein